MSETVPVAPAAEPVAAAVPQGAPSPATPPPVPADIPVTPTLTLASLDRIDGAASPSPFVFGIGSRRVVFPDPMGLSPVECERFMRDLAETESLSGPLRRWLQPDDAELLLTRLTARQTVVLLKQATAHYQAFLGAPGEGAASNPS